MTVRHLMTCWPGVPSVPSYCDGLRAPSSNPRRAMREIEFHSAKHHNK